MNSLIQNYEIILTHLKYLSKDLDSYPQIRKPKLSNLEIVALNLTSEYKSIDSELQLFRDLKGTYLADRIERSNYNKRRRKLKNYIESIRKVLREKFSSFTDVFIIDSMPTPICKYARAQRSKICSTYDIQPAFGRCAAQKSNYFGYKFHAVCNKNGVFHSFDLSPANVHDVNYRPQAKNGIKFPL